MGRFGASFGFFRFFVLIRINSSMTSVVVPLCRKLFQSIDLRSRSIMWVGGRSFVSFLARYAASSACCLSVKEGPPIELPVSGASVEAELTLP